MSDRSLVYDFDAGFDDPGNKNAWFANIIGRSKTVLEVGCATGYVGEYLARELSCSVTGVELVPEAAARALARDCYQAVVVGDVHSNYVMDQLATSRFDFILFGDVVEHLIDPVSVLRSTANLLEKGGQILICVPNIVHWSMRLRILFGRFQYEDTGILDRTHLHFYTPDTVRDLVAAADLIVSQSSGVVWLPSVARRLPAGILRRLEALGARLAPNLMFGQTLLAVHPTPRSGVPDSLVVGDALRR